VNSAPAPYGEVCVAVYQPDPALLERQLRSIADQTLTGWRCHIGIDGWDPSTASLVEELVHEDRRFVVHHFADNVGFYRNFERTIAAVGAHAGWVALADQDDYWYPQKLDRLVDCLETTGAMAASGQARVVNRDGAVIATTNRRDTRLVSLMFDNQVTGSMTIFRGAILPVALPFPEPTDAAYHDHWLGVTAKILGRVVFLEDCLQDYIQHGANVLGEEQGHRVSGRLHSLRKRARSGGGALRYLATHRWGWRVLMARTLLGRVGTAPATAEVRPVAHGSLTPRVLRELISAALAREMPVGRGLGLLTGAFGWTVLRLNRAPNR